MIEQPMLRIPNFTKVSQVDYDASGKSIRVILNQEGRPIAYFKQKLNEAKQKHSIYEQKLYSYPNTPSTSNIFQVL